MGWGLAAVVGVFSQTLECLLTIHSSVEGVLESFHFGLFPENASVNSCRQVCPWTYSLVSLGCEWKCLKKRFTVWSFQ